MMMLIGGHVAAAVVGTCVKTGRLQAGDAAEVWIGVRR